MKDKERTEKSNKGGFIDYKENEKIMITPPLYDKAKRPCIVEFPGNNQKKALFHRWIDKSEIIEPSPMVGGHEGGVLKFTLAIIELEDGSVRCVLPERIRFTDNLSKRERS